MASAFKPGVPVIGWRTRNPEIIYHFDSLNQASKFCNVDTKSVLLACRGDRLQAKGWRFCYDGTIDATVLKQEAKRRVFRNEVIVA